MNLSDNVKNILEGEFTISVVDAITGEVLESETTKNVIVLDSRETIVHAISATSVSYTISGLKFGEDIGDRVTGTPSIIFANDNPDTITRDAGSYINDGFVVGDTITIRDTTFNDGEYILDAVTALVLTVSASDFLTNETLSSSYISRGSDDAPTTPVNTYDTTDMIEVYTVPSTLTVGYPDSQTVNFSVTIVGSDVLSYYGGETSKIFTSAELLTGDGRVFAYKRFAKKSISALVNLVVSWNIGY